MGNSYSNTYSDDEIISIINNFKYVSISELGYGNSTAFICNYCGEYAMRYGNNNVVARINAEQQLKTTHNPKCPNHSEYYKCKQLSVFDLKDKLVLMAKFDNFIKAPIANIVKN